MWRNLPLNIYFGLVTAFVQGNSKTRAVGFEHATHYTIWKELPARHHKLERLMDELPWAPKEQGQDFGATVDVFKKITYWSWMLFML